MSTLQYRCYFFDPAIPRPERPVQAFFTHRIQADDWAAKQLAKAKSPNAEVWLYKIEEFLEGSFKLPQARVASEADVKNPKLKLNQNLTKKEKKENGD